MKWPALFLALLCASCAAHARAHDRSLSHARLVLREDGASVQLRVSALDVNALEAAGVRGREALAAHLQAALVTQADAGACAPEPGSFAALAAATGWSRFEWRLTCPGPPRRLVAALVPSRPSHLTFARVRWEGEAEVHERVLGELAPEAELPRARDASGPPLFVRWIPVGVEHILLGLDHLAFLAMLIVLARSLRDTALMVTGFTLGHSVTLAAAALGVVRHDGPSVEALIGLSVALVAVENTWLLRDARDRATPLLACAVPLLAATLTQNLAFAGIAVFAACYLGLVARAARPHAYRWALAGVFGLLHGFGFAGGLGEAGLPPGEAASALFGFNLGVEIGQLAVVALLWPLLAFVSRRGEEPRRLITQLASGLGAAAGTFWFVTRAFG